MSVLTRKLIIAVFACVGMMLSTHGLYADEGQWPRTIAHDKGQLKLQKKPLRIVSTSPSLTGILLAIDADLIASTATTPSALTDDKGFFTQWSAIADKRGVAILYPNLVFDMEAIIALKPDLVIGSSTGADSILDYYGELKAQNIPTLIVNYSNQSWQNIARKFGEATGNESGAEAAIEAFQKKLQQASAQIKASHQDVTIVGYNIGGSYSIGNAGSPQADILSQLGFHVLSLPEALKGSVSRSSDFDFISHENLTVSIAGKTVFLMRGNEKDVAAFLADPVLRNLEAVKTGQVYPLGISSFRIDYYSGLQMIDEILKHYPHR